MSTTAQKISHNTVVGESTCKIPSGWKRAVLNDICELITDGTHKTPFYQESGVPFLSIANLVPFRPFKFDSYRRFIARKEHEQLIKRCYPQAGDLLVAKIGTLGLTKLVDSVEEFSIFVGLALLKLRKDVVDGAFLEQLLNTEQLQRAMVNASPGSTRLTLTINQIKQLAVALPPLPEQRDIVRILHSADVAIQQTELLIAKLTRIKQGLMQDLLTRGIDEKGNIRNEKTHKFKTSPLGRIPEEWSVKRIIDLINSKVIIDVQDGNHGELYPRQSEFVQEGIPFVSAQHILKNGQIDFRTCPKLPREYVKKLRIGFGRPGDVVLAHNATVGRVGIADDRTEFIVSTSTTYYRVNPDKLDKYFLSYFMQAAAYQRQLADVMGQTTRNQVPITAQKELFMVFPHKNEQSRIARIMSNSDAAIDKESDYLQKLQALKRGLMEDLLTGKVRVNNLLKK